MKKFVLILLCALAAVACEIPFALDDVSDPAIYIQYLPSTETNADILVAYAEPAFGKTGGNKYAFSASDVTVSVNGKTARLQEEPDDSVWNAHTLHVLDVPAYKPGDKVEVSVKGKGIPDVSASTVVPDRPVIKSVNFESVTRDSTDAWKITIELDKPVNDGDFYGIKAIRRSTMVTLHGPDVFHAVLDTTVYDNSFSPGQVASLSDLNSLDLDAFASVNYGGQFINFGNTGQETLTLLTCRQFEGNKYTFYANAESAFWDQLYFDLDIEELFEGGNDADDYPYEGDDDPYYEEEDEDGSVDDGDGDEYDGDYEEDGDDGDGDDDEKDEYLFWALVSESSLYRFEIFHLSDEFYNYAKAQYLNMFNMLSNFGVSPPNFTYSNITGGLGVVAGISGSATDWITPPKVETPKDGTTKRIIRKTK